MKFKTSTTRTALATALILTAIAFQTSTALAQADMGDMPGMATEATPAPQNSPSAATPKSEAVTKAQQEMDGMPGMAPKKAAPAAPLAPKPAEAPEAEADMDAMPGMNPTKPTAGTSPTKNDMRGMPGMAQGRAASKKTWLACLREVRPRKAWPKCRECRRAAHPLRSV